MLIHSLPAPDVVESLQDGPRLQAMLCQAAQGLQAQGADFIAIACNTAHLYHPQVAAAVQIPVLHLPAEAAAAASARGLSCVGLLATDLSLREGLYRQPLRERGIQLVEPDQRQVETITAIIVAILADEPLDPHRRRLRGLVGELQARGAQAVILGCTDLGAATRGLQLEAAILDTTAVLAEAAAREART